jgi:hypothetical protein
MRLDTERFFEEPGNVMSGAAGAGAAAPGRFLGTAQVLNALEWRVCAHVIDNVISFRRSNPVELGPIELHFGSAH